MAVEAEPRRAADVAIEIAMIFPLGLLQGITQRARSIWFRAKQRRYLQRWGWRSAQDMERIATDMAFDTALREHEDMMQRVMWWAPPSEESRHCARCHEVIAGVVCRNLVGGVFHWGCAGAVQREGSTLKPPKITHVGRSVPQACASVEARRMRKAWRQNIRLAPRRHAVARAYGQETVWRVRRQQSAQTSGDGTRIRRPYLPREAIREMGTCRGQGTHG